MSCGAICEGVRVPAVTVFGWDDVLCPTTHARLERRPEPGKPGPIQGAIERRELLKVGQSVVRVVNAAKRHGPVVIVTDSNEHWVRATATLLLPGGSAAMCLDDVEIVSSRESFGQDFPDQPTCWQIAAFSYVTSRHLLSAGAVARVKLGTAADSPGANTTAAAAAAAAAAAPFDDAVHASCRENIDSKRRRRGRGRVHGERSRRRSGCGALIAVATATRAPDDRAAAMTLQEHHANILTKTVSLTEAPTALELKDQLDLLAEKLEHMFGYTTSLERPEQSPAASAAATATAPRLTPPYKSEFGRHARERRAEQWPSPGDLSDRPSPTRSSSPEPVPLAAARGGYAAAGASGGKHQHVPSIHCDDAGNGHEENEGCVTAPCSASTMSSSSSSSCGGGGGGGSRNGGSVTGTPFVAIGPEKLLLPLGASGQAAAAPTSPSPRRPRSLRLLLSLLSSQG